MPIEAKARCGSPGIGFGCGGFSSKPTTRLSASTSTTPNCPAAAATPHRQRADGQVGAGFDVALDQLGVVHLVDVVAGQDHHVLRPLFLDGVDVLVDGVGGALIPVLVDALLRGNDLDELAQLAAEIGLPAEIDVPVEAHRLVLGEDEVLPHPAIEAVREREVDDPIGPAEGNGRFCPISRQRFQPRALSPRENHGQHIFHRLASHSRCFLSIIAWSNGMAISTHVISVVWRNWLDWAMGTAAHRCIGLIQETIRTKLRQNRQEAISDSRIARIERMEYRLPGASGERGA